MKNLYIDTLKILRYTEKFIQNLYSKIIDIIERLRDIEENLNKLRERYGIYIISLS